MIFAKICNFFKKSASFVDLEKPEKMRIWLQNFVSIQPRTSLEKSDVSWPTAGAASRILRGLPEAVEGSAEVPIYIAETAPTRLRGTLGACNQLAVRFQLRVGPMI